MNKIVIDSDVIIDVLSQRQPFFADSAQAINKVIQSGLQMYIAAHTVTNIYYILSKQNPRSQVEQQMTTILDLFSIASITDSIIRNAFYCPMKDFEDAVVSEAAKSLAAQFILTRNTKDYQNAAVPVLNPQTFLTI
ncbi:PIN domain-containing protein [Synechocystis salina LEGE 06155]|nr:PIN domain-containing protein [Synechocystis salina LEGE 06155]